MLTHDGQAATRVSQIPPHCIGGQRIDLRRVLPDEIAMAGCKLFHPDARNRTFSDLRIIHRTSPALPQKKLSVPRFISRRRTYSRQFSACVFPDVHTTVPVSALPCFPQDANKGWVRVSARSARSLNQLRLRSKPTWCIDGN